jgi:flagellar P-ring protein precursor FlgI
MKLALWALALACAPLLLPLHAGAQQVRVGDLVIADTDIPVRVVGYGLVVGLDGTGDRAIGGYGARHTVQSTVNLLRNFGVEVPAGVLRTRNVAAVLVTAEASAFLRPGGRFEVHVSSLGDAASLRGGVLWSTPLVFDPGGPPVATAQGPLLLSEGSTTRNAYTVETTGRIPEGGLLLENLPGASFASASRLVLRQPNLGTATRVAEAVNQALGAGTATVEDPGSITLTMSTDPAAGAAVTFARINELRIEPDATAQILVDTRDGTVVAGGDVTVGRAVVSHGGLTLTVGATEAAGAGASPGEVRVTPGASVQDIAAALHGIGASPMVIAAIFESLHRVGALAAEVRVR